MNKLNTGTNYTTRRGLIAGIVATGATMAIPAAKASVADQVEDVMKTVVPFKDGFVAVDAEALERLCRHTEVEFASHWASRAG